jgi:hypothetical protein
MLGMYNYRGLSTGYRLAYGLGDDSIDPETGLPLGGELPGGGIDFSSGEVDPILTSGAAGPLQSGEDFSAWEGSGETTATPEEQAAAEAWLLQNVPVTARSGSAAALSTLALTAAQIAAGVTAGTVQPAAGVCPSGYKFSTGVCVPPQGAGGGSLPAGQWVSFATNQQITTWGFMVVAALVVVNLLPSGGGGGGRRRR